MPDVAVKGPSIDLTVAGAWDCTDADGANCWKSGSREVIGRARWPNNSHAPDFHASIDHASYHSHVTNSWNGRTSCCFTQSRHGSTTFDACSTGSTVRQSLISAQRNCNIYRQLRLFVDIPQYLLLCRRTYCYDQASVLVSNLY